MLTDIARRAAADFAAVHAFETDAGWSITYAELDRAADEAAAGLAARGIGEGDALALVLPSTVDYVVLYLAAARIGAVTAGINPGLTPREIDSCLRILRPTLVIAAPDLAEAAGAAFPVEVMAPGRSAATAAGTFREAGSPPAPPLPPTTIVPSASASPAARAGCRRGRGSPTGSCNGSPSSTPAGRGVAGVTGSPRSSSPTSGS